jgi:putative restriction endonuclease
MNTDSDHLVEAAHIHKHAESGDNDPRNGLALTPDAHWMFDRGLWTVDYQTGEYVVLVAKGRFDEDSPIGQSLLLHHGAHLNFRVGVQLTPDPTRLRWHQDRVFIG